MPIYNTQVYLPNSLVIWPEGFGKMYVIASYNRTFLLTQSPWDHKFPISVVRFCYKLEFNLSLFEGLKT